MSQSQYASIVELKQLSVNNQAATRFGDSNMTAALRAASSIADSYLASQFTLPLIASPEGWDMGLKIAVCNIAAYLLYSQFGFNANVPTADKLIADRRNEAIDWLKQIANETIHPQWTDSSGASPGAAYLEPGPYVVSDPPVGFTDRGLPPMWPWGCGPWES